MPMGTKAFNGLASETVRIMNLARTIAEDNNQQYYRGPHLLQATVHMGLLDSAIIGLSVNSDEFLDWCRRSARQACASYRRAAATVVDTQTDKQIAAARGSLKRPLQARDLIRLLLNQGVGFTPEEILHAPVSFKKMARMYEKETNDLCQPGLRLVPTLDGITDITLDLSEPSQLHLTEYLAGDEKAISAIVGILGRLSRPNPLLVGDPGIGKTALIRNVMRWMIRHADIPWIKECRIVLVACGTLAAAGVQGRLEDRLKTLLDTALTDRTIIFFFDDIHLLGNPYGNNAGSILNLFNAYLEKDNFRIIASADTVGFDEILQSQRAFLRRFEIIRIKEPAPEHALIQIRKQQPAFTQHYELGISPEVLTTVIKLGQRYMPSRKFPGKAVSILDSAMQYRRQLNLSTGNTTRELTIDDVGYVVSRESGIPKSRLSEDDRIRLRGIDAYLADRVFDQKPATSLVSQAIQNQRLDLGDPNKTAIALLLVGPPGTGKTELAKAVAEYLMGSANALVRFNMSEFHTAESAQRLLGSPPGYVGYTEGGELTNRLMANPFSVILFDELEKASTKVFDILLQVLSDGHLTDNHGRMVDCRNSIFMMTSNALSDADTCEDNVIRQRLLAYRDAYGSGPAIPKFRREFLDRLEIIPFAHLSAETLRRIARREIQQTADRVNNSDIIQSHLHIDECVVEWLCAQIDVSSGGARAVHRLVQSRISRFLSSQFLEHDDYNGKRLHLCLDEKGNLQLHELKNV